MTQAATLFVKISARGAVVGAQKVKRATKSMADGFRKLGKGLINLKTAAIGAFGVLASASIARKIIRAVTEQEDAIAQLEAGLKSTNYQAGHTVASLRKVSKEMQRTTRFSNEAIEEIAGIGLSFTELKDDILPGFLRITADVSTRMGGDLKGTALQLAKALNAPTQNLSALSRSGIQFTKVQRDVIKSLWDTGRQAEAQRVILAELERQYGGSAAAAKDTLGGSIDTLKNSFDDLVKTMGTAARGPLKELVDTMDDVVTTWDKFLQSRQAQEIAEEVVSINDQLGEILDIAFSPKKRREMREGGAETQPTTELEDISNIRRPVFDLGPTAEERLELLNATRAGADAIREVIAAQKQETEALGLSNEERRNRKILLDVEAKAYKELEQSMVGLNTQGISQNDIFNVGVDAIDAQMVKLKEQISLTDEYREKLLKYKELKAVFDSVKRSMAGAFTDMITGAKSAGDAIKDLAGDITRMLIQRAIMKSLSGFGPAEPLPVTGARGLVAMASGEITRGPTAALIGERGPEAVVPLQRDERGVLGLGGGGRGDSNVTFNIISPDKRGVEDSLLRNPKLIQQMNQTYRQGYALG